MVPAERAGIELDEFLCLMMPRANKGFLRRQVNAGRVLVDGMPAHPAQRLRRNQVVVIDIEESELPISPVAPPQPIPILYEDDEVLLVDKPSGLAVEPERWAREAACVSGALLHLALERAAEESGDARAEALDFRPRLVHRIDKDTSGVLLVAKTLEVERRLRRAFDEGRIEKEYWALVEGELRLEGDAPLVLDAPLAPDARRSGRMRVKNGGKPSRTEVEVLERFRGFTLVLCRPRTGRTHQIRVHLMDAGYPLAVDPLYGRREALLLSEIKRDYRPKRGRAERPLIDRLTLHARALSFPTGGDGARRVVEAPVPKDLQRTLQQLGKVRPAEGRR